MSNETENHPVREILKEEDDLILDYIEAEKFRIKPQVRKMMEQRRLDSRDVLAMSEAEFDQFFESLVQNAVPVPELKSISNFKVPFSKGFTREALEGVERQKRQKQQKEVKRGLAPAQRKLVSIDQAALADEKKLWKQKYGLTDTENDFIDQYIEERSHLIDPITDAFMQRHGISPRKILAMTEEAFRDFLDRVREETFEHDEDGISLIQFKMDFIFGIDAKDVRTLIAYRERIKNGKPEPQYAEIVVGGNTIRREIISMLAGIPILSGSGADHEYLLVNGREIELPRHGIRNQDGTRGSFFGLSYATYVDDNSKISAADRQKLETTIKSEYQGYFVIE